MLFTNGVHCGHRFWFHEQCGEHIQIGEHSTLLFLWDVDENGSVILIQNKSRDTENLIHVVYSLRSLVINTRIRELQFQQIGVAEEGELAAIHYKLHVSHSNLFFSDNHTVCTQGTLISIITNSSSYR